MLWMWVLAGSTNEALACGGFACNQQVPVLQNAERIVFGMDGDEVEMHVQISYEGNAQDFAWIVPVPADPELFVTTSSLFTQLEQRTAPIFTLNSVDEGLCGGGGSPFGGNEFAMDDVASTATSGGFGGVTVVALENVGPYESVTLQATSVDALLGWLADNDYNLPDGSEAAIEPYVAPQGTYFVALRLQKNKNVGDLVPLGLRYASSKAIIPVQLTSVSATPDMRMEVYVFADTRAVPESYLHVEINEAAVDWWNFGQNYFDVITQAANQAGGHAFATDFYGSSDRAGDFFIEAVFDEATMRTLDDPFEWMTRLSLALPSIPPELTAVIEDQLGLDEQDAVSFLSCPQCSTGLHFVNGASVATDDLIARVVDPLRAAQALVEDHPKLTRMTSSLDAVEMTVDPAFVRNQDMKGTSVARKHTADQVFECHNGKQRFNAKRRLELENGLVIDLPSQSWLSERGMSELDYLSSLGTYQALVIEKTGATGQPQVLVDHTAELNGLVDDLNRLVGCGCDQGAGAGSLAGLGALSLLVSRRRRS